MVVEYIRLFAAIYRVLANDNPNYPGYVLELENWAIHGLQPSPTFQTKLELASSAVSDIVGNIRLALTPYTKCGGSHCDTFSNRSGR